MKTSDGATLREFESHTLRQNEDPPVGGPLFGIRGWGFEHLNTARVSAAGDGGAPRSESNSDMIASGDHTFAWRRSQTIIFSAGENGNESPHSAGSI